MFSKKKKKDECYLHVLVINLILMDTGHCSKKECTDVKKVPTYGHHTYTDKWNC